MEEKIVTEYDLKAFASTLRREEKSPYTIEKYLRDARSFQTFAAGRPLSKELIVAYKEDLLAGGYAKGSVNSILASVNRLLAFLHRSDCRAANVRIQRDAYRPEEKNLSKAEYLRLWEAAKSKPRLARMYYELSRDVAQLADLLGHSSLNTTRLYLMTTESAVRRKVERLSRLIYPTKRRPPHYSHNVVA